MKPRGPWCTACGHEYRTKTGQPEPFARQCTYCGSSEVPRQRKPFHEFSKSQIEKYGLPGDPNGCPTRYFFKYVLHLPEPPNEYAEFGIFGHGLAEEWMLRRVFPQVNSLEPKSTQSRAALSLLGGIPHMPPPTLPGLQIESEFHFEFEGIRFMGYKDVWAPLTKTQDPAITAPDRMRFVQGVDASGAMHGGQSVVGDWKFVGQKSFTTYRPTPEKLAIDLQATIEAYDDVRRGASDVYLNWVYMPRGERNGAPVRAWVSASNVIGRMREITATAREMKSMLDYVVQTGVKDARMMRTNSEACKSYGKVCAYLDRCHVSTHDRTLAALSGLHDPKDLVRKQEKKEMTQPAPGGLAGLVPMINGLPTLPGAPPAGAPPFAMAPPPAPPAPPPAAALDPQGQYNVMWGGKPYVVLGSQVDNAVKAGAQLLGPVGAAPPASPPAAVASPDPAPPPAMAAPPVPPPAAAAAVRGTRGRRAKTQVPAPQAQPGVLPMGTNPAPGSAPEIDGDEYDDAVADAIEALNQTLAGGFKLLEAALSRRA